MYVVCVASYFIISFLFGERFRDAISITAHKLAKTEEIFNRKNFGH